MVRMKMQLKGTNFEITGLPSGVNPTGPATGPVRSNTSSTDFELAAILRESDPVDF